MYNILLGLNSTINLIKYHKGISINQLYGTPVLSVCVCLQYQLHEQIKRVYVVTKISSPLINPSRSSITVKVRSILALSTQLAVMLLILAEVKIQIQFIRSLAEPG